MQTFHARNYLSAAILVFVLPWRDALTVLIESIARDVMKNKVKKKCVDEQEEAKELY